MKFFEVNIVINDISWREWWNKYFFQVLKAEACWMFSEEEGCSSSQIVAQLLHQCLCSNDI